MSDTPSSTDPFDPAVLRISVDYAAETPVQRMLTTVPVTKPRRETFVRVRPEPEYQQDVLVLKHQQESYIVHPSFGQALQGEARPMRLYTTITRQSDLLLWAVGLPGPDGRHNPWHASAMAAAERAKTHWVRVAANQAAGYYDVHVALGDLGEPQWPEESFRDLLRIACQGGGLIDSLDHAVLRKLRGEI